MTPLTDEQKSILLVRPELPSDYLAWMISHGWGELSESSYMMYAAPVPLRDVDESAPEGYASFGDNLCGVSGCISLQGDGLVHEWDSSTSQVIPTGQRFAQYIAQFA
jgi:hypothetical protein